MSKLSDLERISEQAATELNIDKEAALALLKHLHLEGLLKAAESGLSFEGGQKLSFGDLRVSARVANLYVAQ